MSRRRTGWGTAQASRAPDAVPRLSAWPTLACLWGLRHAEGCSLPHVAIASNAVMYLDGNEGGLSNSAQIRGTGCSGPKQP